MLTKHRTLDLPHCISNTGQHHTLEQQPLPPCSGSVRPKQSKSPVVRKRWYMMCQSLGFQLRFYSDSQGSRLDTACPELTLPAPSARQMNYCPVARPLSAHAQNSNHLSLSLTKEARFSRIKLLDFKIALYHL